MEDDDASVHSAPAVGEVGGICSYQAARHVPSELARVLKALAPRYPRWRAMLGESGRYAFPVAFAYAVLEWCMHNGQRGMRLADNARGEVQRAISDGACGEEVRDAGLLDLLSRAADGSLTEDRHKNILYADRDELLRLLQAVACSPRQLQDYGPGSVAPDFSSAAPSDGSFEFDEFHSHVLAEAFGVHLSIIVVDTTPAGELLPIGLGKEMSCQPPQTPSVTLITYNNTFDVLYLTGRA
eukprot:TRINITY_DN21590_c0_g1_i1.p2 TRINITY_DN21590_c0_g1~~TRINITY_DN21590_c0_g1_i1.p2  ORF type:complete len:265 (+),score=76.72 TRINITY_DN21590_c0_g1_i1:77-796(+)